MFFVFLLLYYFDTILLQVGSHYHFIEVNPYLIFDRRRAYGMRLNISAGTATRFEVMPINTLYILDENFLAFVQLNKTQN